MIRGSSLVSILGAALALASLGGCSGGGGSGSGGGGSGGSGGNVANGLAQLWAENAKATCKQLFSCCNDQELTDKLSKLTPVPTTQAECASALAVKLGDNDWRRVRAVDEGRLAFHADRGALCMQKTAAASCADYFINNTLSKDPDCEATLEGLVAPGGDCSATEECAGSGVLCDGADNAAGVLGKCVVLPGEGKPCLPLACSDCYGCAAGLHCTLDTTVCQKRLADGAACQASDECQSGSCDMMSSKCATKPPVCDGM
jgi:hypothetical protein